MDFIDHRSTANFKFSLSATDEKFRIKSDGNVGIGVSNPSTKLEVDGVITTAGLTTTADINFGDNDKAVFGAGSDLQIYHDGTHSYVRDEGTGGLILTTNGAAVYIQKGDTETSAEFNIDGAVKLRHDNAQKFSTTSTGVDVTGTLVSDGLTVANTSVIAGDFDGGTAATYIRLQDDTDNFLFGSNNSLGNFLIKNETADALRLSVANTGDISFYEDTGTTAKLFWDASAEALGIGTSSPSAPLDVVSSSGAVGAYIRGRSADNIGSLYFTSNSSASTEYGYVQGRSTDLRIQGFNNGLILQPSSGNVGIGTSSPAAALDISQANARGAYLRSSTTGSRLHFLDSTTAAVSTVGIGAEGNNLVLYGGGAEVVRVASSGNVGIGTDSPDGTLHVKDTVAQVYIQSNDGQSAQIIFGDASDASRGRINYDSSDNIIFENSNLTERMRIDSSGNVQVKGGQELRVYRGDNATYGSMKYLTGSGGLQLNDKNGDGISFVQADGATEYARFDSSGTLLVGKTNDTQANAGHVMFGSGAAYSSRNGFTWLHNRLSTDGDILLFQKDGTTVGSIGTASAYLTIGKNDTGLLFMDASDYIEPFNVSTNAARDAAIDLGRSAARFKDLYLSGNVRMTTPASGNGTLSYDGSTYALTSNSSSAPMTFATYSTERMRLDSSGNLLVGTTTTNIATEGTVIYGAGNEGVMQLSSTAMTALYVNRSNDGELVQFRAANSTVGSIGAYLGDSYVGTGVAGLRFYDAGPAVTPHNTTTNAGTDGTIDLGTSAGRFKDLYLSNNIVSSGASSPTLNLKDTTNNCNILVYAQNSTANVGTYSNHPLIFDTNSTEKARIDSSGNLLVGKTSADNTTQGIRMLGSSGFMSVVRSNDNLVVLNRIDGDGSLMEFRTNGTTRGSISISGSTTSYNTSSDQRLKDNIVDAPSASDDIDAIQVRSFDWKADGSHQKYGMVAQELQSVAPEAVSEGVTEEDMMGVDYSKLVPMMLKEIQSLRARVAQLEGEN